jgi:hypothetical protein
MRVDVKGYWPPKQDGVGPLGQTRRRYPFAGGVRIQTRTLELTPEEAEALRNCSLCGRATLDPRPHRGGVHCEVCDTHRDGAGRNLLGWYGGPIPLH